MSEDKLQDQENNQVALDPLSGEATEEILGMLMSAIQQGARQVDVQMYAGLNEEYQQEGGPEKLRFDVSIVLNDVQDADNPEPPPSSNDDDGGHKIIGIDSDRVQ